MAQAAALLLYFYFIQGVIPNKLPLDKTLPVVSVKPEGEKLEREGRQQQQQQPVGHITCKEKCSDDYWDWNDSDTGSDCQIFCTITYSGGGQPTQNIQYVYVNTTLTNENIITGNGTNPK